MVKCALEDVVHMSISVATGEHPDATSIMQQPLTPPSAQRATPHDITIMLLDG